MSSYERRVAGKRLKRIDGIGKVTGKHVYASDFALPGMLFGKILRSSEAHARIVRLDTTIASFLHDTREDTRLSAEQIEDCFGSDVCNIVKVLSKVPKEGYLDRFFVCTDWRPYFVKACDRLDNLRSLSQSPVEFRRKQVVETRDKYYRLFDRMVVLTPEEYRDGVRRLRELVQSTNEQVPLTDHASGAAS